MRPLVLLVALLILSLGLLGVIAPEALMTLARHSSRRRASVWDWS
jgi:Tfp pilus assembly protein PilV